MSVTSTIRVHPVIGDFMIQFRRLWRFMTSVTIVQETLPVDDELDRRAEKKLSEHLASQPSRKLARKS